jgi:hypothetical protein
MNHHSFDLGLAVLCAISKPRQTWTLAAIAAACDSHRERVRQIEVTALDKMARKMETIRLYEETFGEHPHKKESYLTRQYRYRQDQRDLVRHKREMRKILSGLSPG